MHKTLGKIRGLTKWGGMVARKESVVVYGISWLWCREEGEPTLG